MGIKELIVKTLFGSVIREEIEKSSKQVVSHAAGISFDEGILPDIDFEIFNQMYEQTSWVRAVVSVICKAVTARGYSLVPAKPDADPKNAELLQEFFGNCNPNDTLLEILDDLARDVYVFGNAFLELVPGPDGKPRELWNLDATTIRVKADEHGGITGYVQVPRFATTRNQTGRVEFEPREVIHFKLGTKGATLYGLSPLASLILPITVDKFAQVYNRSFFLNGAKIRGAFIMKDATPEQVERNREYMAARAKNPDTAHSDLVMEGDIDFKQIGVNQKDMEFLELRSFTRNEILAVYGVPPSKVSIIDTGNIGSGTGEHQTQTFYDETILPFQMRVAEKINKHVIRKGFGISDWSFQFNKRAIDEKDQAEIFNVYLQNGVFTAEEVRRMVAPRMPELQKGMALSKAIVASSREAVEIEERFARAMERLFREIKAAMAAGLPALGGEATKQLDDLEVLLELIDKDKIARVVQGFTLESARKGLALSARRNGLKDVDEPSLALQEKIRSNALSVATNVSESLKAGLRQALIDGVAANETIPQLMRRIEEQLDSPGTFTVKPVLDDAGNVLRVGGTRRLDRSTLSEMIARTEANRAYNEGNLDALKQADVDRVQFLLASDACPLCVDAAEIMPGEKLGRIMSIDDVSGTIPIHPNCRCTWVTVLEER
ncbi:MAG TPA: phage portal protein [Elusimicrobia bacterium]|nr:phage portal protein [Elusimicrobiota bacterium]HBT60761.1 phage portal protein [Elusimicrobiota bacterium]